MAPTVDDFIFRRALRMSEGEFLRGSAAAAVAVNSALRDALQDNSTPLTALGPALEPSLHSMLCSEMGHARSLGEASLSKVLATSIYEREQLLHEPELVKARMIIGAQRECIPRENDHRFAIGSCLVVCDRSDYRLWSTERQAELLAEHGCTVQLTVSFNARHEAETEQHAEQTEQERSKPQLYTFEAAVDGQTLTGESQVVAQICLVDLNDRMCTDFWSAAAEVRLLD